MAIWLECGPATRQDLIDLAYPDTPPNAAQKRFEKDLDRLRYSLDLDIEYDPIERVYRLRSVGTIPLLGLSNEAMRGLAFLADTFRQEMPQFHNIQALLDSLMALLPYERRAELMRLRSSLAMDLRQRDNDEIDPAVWHSLEVAYLHRRMVQFQYVSPRHEDQLPRQHLVEARQLYFDTDRRHYYLRGYCQRVNGPLGEWTVKRFIRYRIGRIVAGSVEILPERFPTTPPSVPIFPIKYRLSPTIARLGISEHFESLEVEYSEDGYATICAETDDIFYAVRTLLYYGDNCEILGGPVLVAEYRRILIAMLRQNDINPSSLTDAGGPI